MNEIDIHIHTDGEGHSKTIKIAEDATIGRLLELARAAGAAIGESGEEIILLIENKETRCHKDRKIHECGIKHGHHVHCPPQAVIIIVNTREKKWGKKEISFEEVVVLAFGAYSTDPDVVYTVKYSRGPEHHREGSLVKGHSVKVKWGMVFDVTQTNKS